jgi:diguanylate cyclase (GGDEF)-like protein
MPMGSRKSKFTSSPPEPHPGLLSQNIPSDVAVLDIAVDSQPVFRGSALRFPSLQDRGVIDDVFQTLLSEANEEFTSLLRDVQAESHRMLPSDPRTQRLSVLLTRAVRCATKQYLVQAELGNLALTDELTGLYNRRGFMAMAERQLKLGRRSGRELLLFVMDLDGLKHINDSFGHLEGDRALKRTAEALEETFRDSDVVARLGGDEFAVLAIEADGHSESTIRTRFLDSLKSNSDKGPVCEISLSLGVARFDPWSYASIGELMVKADQAMYEQKRRRSRLAFEREASTQSQ